MNAFQCAFANRLTTYVQLRRQLGLRFKGQEAVLHAFDRYAQELDYQGPLTEQFAQAFAFAGVDPATQTPARRYLVIRHFAEYLATYDPGTPRLDPKAIRLRRQQPPAYIFTEQEIAQLLVQAMGFSRRHTLSNVSLRAMIGLAASTGLRPGEVAGLDRADVDLDTGVLLIQRSKLDKDRLVPVHSSTLDVLRAYAVERDQTLPAGDEVAFFLNSPLRRYQVDNIDYLFQRLVSRVNLHSPRGKQPTFRSLRHTFAVHRLVAWHRAGVNVQALLPALATYMGHVHYSSTAYYLTATAEMLGVAAERLGIQEVGNV